MKQNRWVPGLMAVLLLGGTAMLPGCSSQSASPMASGETAQTAARPFRLH